MKKNYISINIRKTTLAKIFKEVKQSQSPLDFRFTKKKARFVLPKKHFVFLLNL